MERYPDGPGFVAGSETSKEAAESVAPHLGKLQGRVMAFVAARGAVGATDWELEHYLGLCHQSASARRRELVLKGLIGKSGRTRATGSGRKANVWVPRQHAVEPEPEPEPVTCLMCGSTSGDPKDFNRFVTEGRRLYGYRTEF